MKNIFFILLSFSFITSCSFSSHGIKPDQMDYVRKAIVCDGKTSNFAILNYEELSEFFDGEKAESTFVKYRLFKSRNVKLDRRLNIVRYIVDGKAQYRVYFKRRTFPFSDCRKLKTEPIYF